MKINLNIFLQIFSIFLGLFFCLFVIWNRLFRTRQLRHLILEINFSIIFSYSLLCLITFILILYNLKLVLKIKTNSKIYSYIEKKPYILYVIEFIIKYILNAPKNLDGFLYRDDYIRPWATDICGYIFEQMEGYYKNKLLTPIYFNCILKLIIASVFLYDILFIEKFTHFFKILPFLLIPVIFQVLLFIIFDFADKNRKQINEWITMEANEDNTGYIVYIKPEYENDPRLTDEIAAYHSQNWQVYINVMMVIDEYYDLEKKIKPFFNIIIYTLYNIGWCYLLYNIHLLPYDN